MKKKRRILHVFTPSLSLMLFYGWCDFMCTSEWLSNGELLFSLRCSSGASLLFVLHCCKTLSHKKPVGYFVFKFYRLVWLCKLLCRKKEVHVVSSTSVSVENVLKTFLFSSIIIDLSSWLFCWFSGSLPSFEFGGLAVIDLCIFEPTKCKQLAKLYPKFSYLQRVLILISFMQGDPKVVLQIISKIGILFSLVDTFPCSWVKWPNLAYLHLFKTQENLHKLRKNSKMDLNPLHEPLSTTF